MPAPPRTVSNTPKSVSRSRGRLIAALTHWFDTDTRDASIRDDGHRIDWLRAIPLMAMHLACFAVFRIGISPIAVVVAVALYVVRMFVVRMFAITGFYHRYFSHRTFRTSRAVQFAFALIGASCVQRGPLWWEAHHPNHHRHADTDHDVHSPVVHGFWRSHHVGWFLSRQGFRTDDASTRKLDRICRKRDLKPDDHAIEIGTGWGVFALYAARHYGCLVTTTTISREQHALAAQRVKDAGLEHRVTLLLEDYRDITGSYDKLVSIEMIEAIGAFIAMWEVYLAYGEGGFRERSIGVAQLLMARPGHRTPAPMPEFTPAPNARSELQA